MSMTLTMVQLDDLLGDRLRTEIDLAEQLLERAGGSRIDLDKSWHAVQFLLDRAGCEAQTLTYGTEEVGEDLGYGPSRWLPHAELVKAAASLPSDPQALLDCYDGPAMNAEGLYPGGFTDPAMGWQEELAKRVPELLAFYRQAIHDEQGLLIAMI